MFSAPPCFRLPTDICRQKIRWWEWRGRWKRPANSSSGFRTSSSSGGVFLFTGFPASCSTSGGARGVGRLRRSRPNGIELSRDALGCIRRRADAAQAGVPNLQRLHHGAAQRAAVRLLSTGPVLQGFRSGGETEGSEEALTAIVSRAVTESRWLRSEYDDC